MMVSMFYGTQLDGEYKITIQ